MLDADAGVAQLVEHHVANVIVVGSSPITRFCVSLYLIEAFFIEQISCS